MYQKINKAVSFYTYLRVHVCIWIYWLAFDIQKVAEMGEKEKIVSEKERKREIEEEEEEEEG